MALLVPHEAWVHIPEHKFLQLHCATIFFLLSVAVDPPSNLASFCCLPILSSHLLSQIIFCLFINSIGEHERQRMV